ncbi:unnamed protein product, partial [Owenia fusiformis]
YNTSVNTVVIGSLFPRGWAKTHKALHTLEQSIRFNSTVLSTNFFLMTHIHHLISPSLKFHFRQGVFDEHLQFHDVLGDPVYLNTDGEALLRASWAALACSHKVKQ